MRSSISRLFLIIALVSQWLVAVVAQGTPGKFPTLPSCATQCLVTAAFNSPCQISNITCMCTTPSLQAEAEECVLRTCSLPDILLAKNGTSTACGAPVRDRGPAYDRMNITFGVISAAIFLARLFFKLFLARTGFWADDWLIVVAFFSAVPSTVMNSRGLVANGLGRDIWTLAPDAITRFAKYFYVMEIMYFTHLPLLKASMLLFYLRVFPYAQTRRLLWATLAVNGVAGLAFLLVVVFQCAPVSLSWSKFFDASARGTCLNLNAVTWSNAAFNIALDLWMLAIPLSQLRKLRLHWRRKLGIGLMFFVGGAVTVVSAVRLRSLVHFANTPNPTWDELGVAFWSTVEINLGVVCACMPALRGILTYFFPGLVGASALSVDRHSGGAATPGPGLVEVVEVKEQERQRESLQHTVSVCPRLELNLGTGDCAINEAASSETSSTRDSGFSDKSVFDPTKWYVVEQQDDNDESGLVIMREAYPAFGLQGAENPEGDAEKGYARGG